MVYKSIFVYYDMYLKTYQIDAGGNSMSHTESIYLNKYEYINTCVNNMSQRVYISK